jgi:hypothetical protein
MTIPLLGGHWSNWARNGGCTGIQPRAFVSRNEKGLGGSTKRLRPTD